MGWKTSAPLSIMEEGAKFLFLILNLRALLSWSNTLG